MAKKMTKAEKERKAQAARVRGARRETAREIDPWFGKRRSSGEMGRHKSKAAKNKNACRGNVRF